MKYIHRILCSLLLSGTFTLAAAQENRSYFLHTIEKGQSLYSIASMYNVSQAEIIRLNPGSDQRIYLGAQLRIPRKSQTADAAANGSEDTFHTIAAGETLYRLSVHYGVTAKAICEANPGLSADNFRTGQVIRIPAAEAATPGTGNAQGNRGSQAGGSQGSQSSQSGSLSHIAPAVTPNCREMHKIKRRETVYSISREYGITEAELIAANPELGGTDELKRGKFLCIPYPASKQVAAETVEPGNSELFRQNAREHKHINTIKAAVMLPFLDVSRGEADRMVEYYEGMLLAVDSLKRSGINLDLYTYNTGGEKASIQGLLQQRELKEMDIIFGPLHQSHIKPLAQFAQKHNIRLVIPFTSKDNTVFRNPAVYQINTPQSYLYSEVYEHFLRQFPHAHVIFIQATQGAKDKEEFISGLRQTLKDKGYSTRDVSENATLPEYKAALSSDRPNIFVPTSGSNLTLIKILPQLTLTVREKSDSEIHLFGYPEWQTYTKDHLESFFELDTYFYSSFYTNNLLPAAQQFTRNYRRWYSKEMDERYPKFGMLGFDTGYFFLRGLARYGSDFEDSLGQMDYTPIQTGFKFGRVNNWGGFVNKKVFFVRFTKNYELVKLDFD